MFEVFLPAAALGVCLVPAGWWGDRSGSELSKLSSPARIALAGGLGAFVLHNTVSLSLSVPGTAFVFWVICGACLAQGGTKASTFKIARWAAAAGVTAGVLAVYVLLWRPVFAKTLWTEVMLAADEPSRSAAMGERAALADPCDPAPAADTARAHLLWYRAERRMRLLGFAYQWSLEAISRHKEGWGYHRLAALVAAELAQHVSPGRSAALPALSHMNRAVKLNPNDARLRIDYAEMLLEARDYRKSLAELAAAENIDSELFLESVRKLNANERIRIEHMRNRCRFDRLVGPSDEE